MSFDSASAKSTCFLTRGFFAAVVLPFCVFGSAAFFGAASSALGFFAKMDLASLTGIPSRSASCIALSHAFFHVVALSFLVFVIRFLPCLD